MMRYQVKILFVMLIMFFVLHGLAQTDMGHAIGLEADPLTWLHPGPSYAIAIVFVALYMTFFRRPDPMTELVDRSNQRDQAEREFWFAVDHHAAFPERWGRELLHVRVHRRRPVMSAELLEPVRYYEPITPARLLKDLGSGEYRLELVNGSAILHNATVTIGM